MLKDGNLAPHIRMPEQKISAPSKSRLNREGDR
jgi:hypothetical protein